MTDSTLFDSPIGYIEITCTSNGVSQVYLGARDHSFSSVQPVSSLLRESIKQVTEYLADERKVFDFPIDWSEIKGFQREVLFLTCDIPFGRVLTYGQIAKMLGKPAASRAVGAALGRNPMPILIPCHRVVAANGALTGYSAAEGIKTKAWLLNLEEHTIVGQKLA